MMMAWPHPGHVQPRKSEDGTIGRRRDERRTGRWMSHRLEVADRKHSSKPEDYNGSRCYFLGGRLDATLL